ncbi:FecCD family ABC transporter permease [Yinghuangia sp. YIM S10712]|uniref:FecCD family ABC transporter permease n=1 Tax=Yinghuangia sp. YIM S10712 TaxID=3436930 RepID=UPI003F53A353
MVLLLGAVAVGLCLGTPAVGPGRVFEALGGDQDVESVIIRDLRLPRVLLGVLAGACLAAAGLVLQEALRNPLAVPEMLGVSSGAALGVAVPLVASTAVPAVAHPLLAIAGAVAGGLATVVAAGFGRSPAAVLLVGAAVAAAFQSALLMALVMADQLDLQLIYRFLMGSLSGRTWSHLDAVWPWLLASLPALVACVPVLGVLRLGDGAAQTLGLHVHRARLGALAAAILLIAPIIAICGPIAWIGFLAPHVARALHPRADAVQRLAPTMLWGAVCTVGADQAARLAFAPVETPVGAWTALVGVPIGTVLLKRSGRAERRNAVAGVDAAGAGGGR